MCASRASERNAREFYDTKQRAVKFYKENGVPERLEEILNSMFYENPPDVYGRLSEHFESLSAPPVIHKVDAREVLDSRGQPTLQADVYCIVKGLEQHLSTVTMASTNLLMENAPIDRKEADEKERQQFVDAALGFIHGPITEAVSGISPANQGEIDENVWKILTRLQKEKEEAERKERERAAELEPPAPEPAKEEKIISPKGKKKLGSAKSTTVVVEEPKEPLLPGCNAACVVSQAVAVAAAKLAKIQTFEHIANLYSAEEQQEFELPLLMVNLLNSGKAYPGKQNLIKELLLIPKPGKTLRESLKQLTAVHHQVSKLLFPKLGVAGSYVNDLGGYCPQYDRPEQLLDLAQEAITALELTPGEDIFIGLNCAASEMFDSDKGKYEMAQGMLKLPDDMVEVYADLINRYPAIVALVDPFKKQDTEQWRKLCERFSEQCFIVGDRAYPRAECFCKQGLGELCSSAISLKLEQMTSVSGIVEASKLVKENDSAVVISSVIGESPDSFLADLAVGVGAKFVKFGALARGERISKYNRLLEIEDMLAAQDRIKMSEGFGFPVIKPPEPEETAENENKEG
ncbi:enolase 4-like isoform X1 [Patiria miniata]|nr:enolase 4-like isoform X1 [Patiria miniata]XP_038070576.1 enolase 4-like isoform X1 [Patiria miniata]XP_038070577.1 enolase 4-like isoform X1 [Patiria miniata]XP_038070578.1 enolase 4-like isoform X1 [Patiria miniata]XP_038070579.1 enolase 4-like isoform X1 [Patiria miniata]XP_038070580.1 enolase 4-like isoform X1 [Patiria miniata]